MSIDKLVDEAQHAPGALGGGYTLCGVAFEGNPGEADQPPPIVSPPGRPITCGQCVAIISHCRDNFQSQKIRGMYRRAAAK